MNNNPSYTPSVIRYAKLLRVYPRSAARFSRQYPRVTTNFLYQTNFLKNIATNQERVWYILNGKLSSELCNTCGILPVPFNRELKLPRRFCSAHCASSNQEVKIQKQQTFQNKYGISNILQNRQIIINAMMIKYGVKNPSSLEFVKLKKQKTSLKNYGVMHSINMFNTKEYILEKYGVENISQLPDVKAKKLKSYQARYNVINPTYIGSNPKVYQQLNDIDWLYDQYITHNKTAIMIATELNINDTTVGRYLKRHEIAIKYTYGYSIKCIKWLEEIAKNNNIYIQHAGNVGEYTIPNTRIRVDGYCSQTNTIYEFHGDIFHGNPNIFNPSECPHPWSTLNASQLLDLTIQREQFIKSLGFTLVVQWENDPRLIRKVEKLRTLTRRYEINIKLEQ